MSLSISNLPGLLYVCMYLKVKIGCLPVYILLSFKTYMRTEDRFLKRKKVVNILVCIFIWYKNPNIYCTENFSIAEQSANKKPIEQKLIILPQTRGKKEYFLKEEEISNSILEMLDLILWRAKGNLSFSFITLT